MLFGRGFSQKQAEALYEKFGSSSSGEKETTVLWAASDDAKRPEGAEPPADAEKVMLSVLKKVLEEWRAEGGKEGKFVLY